MTNSTIFGISTTFLLYLCIPQILFLVLLWFRRKPLLRRLKNEQNLWRKK